MVEVEKKITQFVRVLHFNGCLGTIRLASQALPDVEQGYDLQQYKKQ